MCTVFNMISVVRVYLRGVRSMISVVTIYALNKPDGQ